MLRLTGSEEILSLTKHVPLLFRAEFVDQIANDRSCECVTNLAEHHHETGFCSRHLQRTFHKQQQVAKPNASAQIIEDVTQSEANL